MIVLAHPQALGPEDAARTECMVQAAACDSAAQELLSRREDLMTKRSTSMFCVGIYIYIYIYLA
jgi:hypothetical protein